MSSPTLPKILLIDSNVFLAKRLTDALRVEGLDVTHSTQSAYGLTMLEWNTPAAILCATNLREMGAIELPRIVHGDHKTSHVPIIALGDGGAQALLEAFRGVCESSVKRNIGTENSGSHTRRR